MNWRYVDDKRIIVGDTLVELPAISVNTAVNISATVALDGLAIPLEQAYAVLLAQRGLLLQETADLKEELQRTRAAGPPM